MICHLVCLHTQYNELTACSLSKLQVPLRSANLSTAKVWIDSSDSCPPKRTLTQHNKNSLCNWQLSQCCEIWGLSVIYSTSKSVPVCLLNGLHIEGLIHCSAREYCWRMHWCSGSEFWGGRWCSGEMGELVREQLRGVGVWWCCGDSWGRCAGMGWGWRSSAMVREWSIGEGWW